MPYTMTGNRKGIGDGRMEYTGQSFERNNIRWFSRRSDGNQTGKGEGRCNEMVDHQAENSDIKSELDLSAVGPVEVK